MDNMDLIKTYRDVRSASLSMVEPLEIEDYLLQPVYFASPPKWNLGHTTWFFEDMVLKPYDKNYKPYNAHFSFIFNSYYNSFGKRVQREGRGDLSRPTVDEVLRYREYVDEHMLKLISAPVVEKVSELITLGLNHEQQHQELFYTDLKYAFSINPLYPKYNDTPFCEGSNQDTGFLDVTEGVYQVGYDGTGFCYDNEAPKHKVYLNSYSISKALVTNGDYIDFIEDGAYNNLDLWHDEAISWLSVNGINKPLYWQQEKEGWHQYTLAGLRKIQKQHILTHISFYEAAAFARWKGMRLPTEFEWETAAPGLNWGKRWEWTESAYLPYPGYIRDKGPLGEYNGKFMVNQKVLRGKSVVTPPGHERITYRNFFHPQMGYQFNGIRLAK